MWSPADDRRVGVRVPAHPMTLELLAAVRRRARRTVGQPLRPGQPDHCGPRARRPRRRRRLRARRRPVPGWRRVDDRRLHRGSTAGAPPGRHLGRGDRVAAEHVAGRGSRAEPGAGDAGSRTMPRDAGCCWPDPSAEARRWPPPCPGAEILDDADLVRYATSLYSRLRDADDRGVDTVIAVLPPARRPRPRHPRPPHQSRRCDER